MRTRVNKIEAMYERPRVNVKVEPLRSHGKIARQWKWLIFTDAFLVTHIRGKIKSAELKRQVERGSTFTLTIDLRVDFQCRVVLRA